MRELEKPDDGTDMKHHIFRAGLSALSKSGAARLMASRTRGLGAILMFHHVRPSHPKAFDPHRILEITPAFLDAVLCHVKARGYEIIPLDVLAERITQPRPDCPFVVLTFDDGYRDNAEHALPVLKRHNAPFTVFATTGFADATAPLWWTDLEDVVVKGQPITVAGQRYYLSNMRERSAAFKAIYNSLREQPGSVLQDTIAELAREAGMQTLARTRALCLNWDGLRQLSAEPLCTIGAHTLTHPLLAMLDPDAARHQMLHSKTRLERELQCAVTHVAYPVGDHVAAGPREFKMASELGFATGVTTRPGVVFADHAAHVHALPRLSVNGLYQSIADFDVLLSGAAFWLFNKARKLNID
jgi:peptidoglycan/xylan/chitin deacetylase (PgdA/CDA1 family)